VQPGNFHKTHALHIAQEKQAVRNPCKTSYPLDMSKKFVSKIFAAYIVYLTIINMSVRRLNCILGLPGSTLGRGTSSLNKLAILMEQRPS
jgi:hypothetical protein